MKKYTSVKKNIIKHELGSGQTYFTVNFVTSTYKKILGCINNITEKVIEDETKFYHIKDAENYAKYSIAPGVRIFGNNSWLSKIFQIKTDIDNYSLMFKHNYKIYTACVEIGYDFFKCFDIYTIKKCCASPELFKKIEEYYNIFCAKKQSADLSSYNNVKYVSYDIKYNEKSMDSIQIYFIASSYFAESHYLNKITSDEIIAFSDKADITLYKKLEELYSHKATVVSSLTSFDYETVKTENQLINTRNALIDEEISRIEKYKEFLLTLKK